MFSAALFDYNGVLVDDELVHLAAFRDTLAPLGVELSERDYWDHYLGYDDDGAFRAILRDSGKLVEGEQIAALIAKLIEKKKPLYLERARRELKVFPGAADLVRLLAHEGPVAVVSGALRDEIELGLGVLGVRDLIGRIVAAEETQAGKPDPEGYLLGMAWLEQEAGAERARRALVIEDSLSGIEAAKHAGLTCLAVAHSYKADELRQAGADEVVESIGQVRRGLLEELYRRRHG